jgi:chemotaxis protein MotA
MAFSMAGEKGTKPDIGTLIGLLVALGGIIGGLLLEGGKVQQLLQPTAAMIVFGGTIGAVMVTVPLRVFTGAMGRLMSVFFEREETPEAVIEEIIGYATKARKTGIVSLEEEADQVRDPFLRKALSLAVDGADIQEIRKMMELEMELQEHRSDSEAKVFEQAGGYAPTIGIIGAVLGLIQVMQRLDNIEEVGKGISVAFVATIYGVGAANIFFLPAASKIKARTQASTQMKELMLEGVTGIAEGLNPKLIRNKLSAYVHAGDSKPARRSGKKQEKQKEPAALTPERT